MTFGTQQMDWTRLDICSGEELDKNWDLRNSGLNQLKDYPTLKY